MDISYLPLEISQSRVITLLGLFYKRKQTHNNNKIKSLSKMLGKKIKVSEFTPCTLYDYRICVIIFIDY